MTLPAGLLNSTLLPTFPLQPTGALNPNRPACQDASRSPSYNRTCSAPPDSAICPPETLWSKQLSSRHTERRPSGKVTNGIVTPALHDVYCSKQLSGA